ncbi:Holliday junction branch migration protein RuvA [Paludicola sp. MB14-C6]|uniref:Holliday junction branch migration protein RuvA n=1 Tax=Paludihabitans sp. MB14-C6 TaxID=3070656 RepID=UPI0027DBC333|nr:Holliday junction branch migration protein RuvA [Paludicola sp. MB14-C6]WMJ23291.1 Holliday junction branch migration protein RuvA [Paludicola sp. MB14-C6]
MIYSVSGKLIHIEPSYIVIECNGIGYSIRTSMTTVAKLPQMGEKATVFTYLHVREDALELFGFYDLSELNTFKMLISISGVGPKAAISILSDLTPERFALCVATGDAKSLTKAQGIGLKTAQRIVLELKDKVAKEQIASGVVGETVLDVTNKTGNASEAISALVVLGYAQSDATQVITKLDSSMSVEDMIKNGLKALAGKL